MAQSTAWQPVDDDDFYALPESDRAGILSSTRIAVEQGENVWINMDQVVALCEQWIEETPPGEETAIVEQWNTNYHFYDGSERTVNWLLLLDALNFCFWGEKDQPRWTIDYRGETLNGYWAEAASLTRAVEEGMPLWDAKYLSTISAETMAQIFRGSQAIPLLEQRVMNAQEVGRVLLEQYAGQFAHAIEQVEGSAVELALLLAKNFPSFNDIATYRNHHVRFLKRAQICAADIHHAFMGKQWGAFRDLDELTIFADYKLPQVLRYYNVLEYHPTLAKRIDNQGMVDANSEEEVEIRATTIWACELLRRMMHQRGFQVTSAEIDQRLWSLGQKLADMKPYHRTRTIFY
jgi:Potential Queuosine, Q, salvage protein family